MRILHTSDWHLGRTFGPISLADDQHAFVDWLVDTCREQRIDLVVIAGDIYDRAIAPNESIVLFSGALRRLLETGAKVAVITGNHDSPDRVASYDTLLDRSGVVLRGGYSNMGEVLPVDFADGRLDLVLLPFLDPQAAPDDLPTGEVSDVGEPDDGAAAADDAVTTGSGAAGAFDRRMRRTHQSVLAAAISAARPKLTAPRSLAVAHAFVAGAAACESERQLTVGGTGTVPAALFEGFSYTALGHLHRPQQVTGSTPIRYSGTPLAYSFSEDHPKSVTVVDMAADGTCTTEAINIPVGRRVATITGTIAELLDPARHRAAQGRIVRANVTDRETVLDAKVRLQQLYPWVVEVRLVPAGVEGTNVDAPIEIRELSPLDATRQFWEAAEGSPPDDATLELLLEAVGAAVARSHA
jgi:DNA repair protein SbcD/Mre11